MAEYRGKKVTLNKPRRISKDLKGSVRKLEKFLLEFPPLEKLNE